MPDDIRRSIHSDKELELMRSIRDSSVVDFDQLGKLVARVTPELFDPGVVADDYIATGYTSVVHVWKTGSGASLEEIAGLINIGNEMRR
jgi:hypothetical protein